MQTCVEIHRMFHNVDRHSFPFDTDSIPTDGIYLLFEKGEHGHSHDRIVRVGSHTGKNQLPSRLMQHFVNENKDRSIFRKNIGRAILCRDNDRFLEHWELDLTARRNKEKYSEQIDFVKQKEVERQVSEYIQNSFTFMVFEVKDKEWRKALKRGPELACFRANKSA